MSDKVTLYHRSPKIFKVGQILTAQMDEKTGQHWLASKRSEKDLEEYREKNHPDLPSRLNCVYATFNPRSRFLSKGYLYAIEPIGKVFIANSRLIDQMAINDSDGYGSYTIIEEYWDGVEPARHNINDVEVLVDSARVIEVIEEPKRLQVGTKFIFGPDAPQISCSVNVAGSLSKNPTIYASDGKTIVPVEDALKMLDIPGARVGQRRNDTYPVTIGPGFEGCVCAYTGPDPGRLNFNFVPSISVSSGDKRSSDSIWMRISSREDASLMIKAFRADKIKLR